MIGSWRSLAGESGPRGAVPVLLLAVLLAGCSLFGGENKVSCWTCHHGKPKPELTGGR